MNFNVYLPDELGVRVKEAKAAGLLRPSEVFREAIEAALQRRTMMSTTLEDPETYEVYVEDADGRSYTGRITGVSIASDDRTDVEIFLTTDERVIAYDGGKSTYFVLDDPVEQLRGWLPASLYAQAVEALGETPIIDL
jgi:hypothetical protein